MEVLLTLRGWSGVLTEQPGPRMERGRGRLRER